MTAEITKEFTVRLRLVGSIGEIKVMDEAGNMTARKMTGRGAAQDEYEAIRDLVLDKLGVLEFSRKKKEIAPVIEAG